MMTSKDLLLKRINDKYQTVEQVLQSVPKASADSLRSILEACVKLVCLIKFEKDPNKRGFSLSSEINGAEFAKLFSPLTISDMNAIKDLGNESLHNNIDKGNIEGLSASELIELFERLKKIIRETEKILGFSIIKLFQEEKTTPKPENPLLNKMVKHWIYGEGKIIKVVDGRMTVQFAKKQEEYGQESLKNGFLKLVDTQKTKVEPTTPRTYAPNIPEVKQALNTTVITPNEIHSKSISKFDAIRRFKNSGLNILSKNCTFASKNSMSYLYWANPKTDLLENDWWLILNDNINYKLHIFKIPANSLDVDMIKVRADKPYLIDLQILFDDEHFTDTRSNIQFAKWYIKTLSY